ncbi:nuclear condensing complex subunit [Irpex rosettiformis]|uniref:Nuclear condensing complex subunit n=1 Tax=Irpex rosettiformis TaxID=378272 RepID=A0ACB8U7X2_9APHY|nr:nuclear condensing complex subunit [Irpex rosettiformis]
MPARSAFTLDSLSTELPKIFEQVQLTSANHQKNLVALYKLQTEAAKITESVQNGKSIKLVGERAFEDTLLTMLSRTMPVKKGATVADRVIKFVGGFTKFINEKAHEEREKEGLDEDDDTTASRFVARLLKFLFRGSLAKDKIARFRAVQCIAEMVAHLGEIEEDVYNDLRMCLLERVNDKEAPVRVQAVIALSKLCGSEDPSEEPNITDVLVDTLSYDTSAEVRRAALANLPINERTIPAMLARTRDVDPNVRKLVYSSVLEPHCTVVTDGENQTEVVGPTHPRVFSIEQRELVVRNGLGDREEAIKSAAAKLVSTWVDVVRVGTTQGDAKSIEEDIIAFLELFDLVENSTAEDALASVFKSRTDILDALEFNDAFWESLTPEKTFLARVFVDHCFNSKDEARLENSLPVVTMLAFRIQSAWQELIAAMQAEEEDILLRGGMDDEAENELRAKREEERLDQEFIIGEMLRMAVNLDYADEIGRRKMFQLVRTMICQDILPEGLLGRCLDVLRTLSLNERDLIRVVVEVVHELRDPADEEEQLRDDTVSNIGETPASVKTVRAAPKPLAEMTPEEQVRADAIDLRCLALCIGMLERVNGTFEENSTLEGILGELIIPAVKRKELSLRERGLVCLGLCCLIARRMAMNSFQLFLSQVQAAPEPLKVRVLHVVFDILMVHDKDFLGPNSTNGERIIEFLLHILDNEESDKVQALLCVGIAKLMLSGMISDDRVLISLMLKYVSPDTAHNQELRQCLSYFLPVYCYSSGAHQRRMQKAFIQLYKSLSEAYKEWDSDDDMISPVQASLMIVDWTDPQKAHAIAQNVPGHAVDESIHIDLAADIIRALFDDDFGKEDKKALCQLLGKLHLPDQVDDDKIRSVKLLMHNLNSRRPLRDASTRNAFAKFEASVSKKYERQLTDFNEDEYRQLEYLQELFEFLDGVVPEDDDDEAIELPKKKGGKKRRSDSISTESDTSVSGMSGDDSPPPASKRKSSGKAKAKRPRLSQSDNESEAASVATSRAETPSAVITPSRVMPKRSAAVKSRAAVSKNLAPPPSESEDDEEDRDEDDEEDEEEDDDPTPAPNRIRKRTNDSAAGIREAARRVSEVAFEREDSIMDSSSDEDADEVDDLL